MGVVGAAVPYGGHSELLPAPVVSVAGAEVVVWFISIFIVHGLKNGPTGIPPTPIIPKPGAGPGIDVAAGPVKPICIVGGNIAPTSGG